jgi:hypothetical protein
VKLIEARWLFIIRLIRTGLVRHGLYLLSNGCIVLPRSYLSPHRRTCNQAGCPISGAHFAADVGNEPISLQTVFFYHNVSSQRRTGRDRLGGPMRALVWLAWDRATGRQRLRVPHTPDFLLRSGGSREHSCGLP